MHENPLFPVYKPGFNLVDQENQESGFLEVEEGVREIGHGADGFRFDNELARHRVLIEPCQLSRGLVTNGEFIEFIRDRGYERFELWLDEGWTWVRSQAIKAPLYWREVDGQWMRYGLDGLQPVEPERILAHVSFYEAAAFAEWKGMRLLTEFEWEAASDQLAWGQRWEWTQSAYLPYPGFARAPGAVGEYNGKFMVNQMVLRGASTATSPGHSRPTYRNFFHPHHRWQCTGIRLAKR